MKIQNYFCHTADKWNIISSTIYSHTLPEKFENGAVTLKTHHMFSVHTREGKNTHLSPVIVELCVRKTRAVKSPDYCDAIVSEKLRFQNVLRAH